MRWAVRHGALLWVLAALVSIWTVSRTAKLYIGMRSDLEELLPADAPSVRALEELRRRLPGIQYVGVVVEAGEPRKLPAAERFLDDLAARVSKYPPELVAGVRTGIAAERAFLERHASLYADAGDLREIKRRIEARRDYEATKAMGADIVDDEPVPSVDFSDIEKRYRSRVTSADRFPKDRFTNEAESLSVMLVETGGYVTGMEQARALLDRMHADVRDLGGPERYGSGMRLGMSGDPIILVEELSALVTDLTFSSVLVLVAVVTVLLLYYRWWRAVPALVLPLLVAAAGSFAMATLPPFRVAALNSNTAFLGSIIVGNGINFGIILLARYVEERRRGASQTDALAWAVHATRTGTITAAAAAGVAYGSLVLTRFRGFWQFGAIGGLGMLLCWAVTFLLMPSLVSWLDRSPRAAPRPLPEGSFSITEPVARFVRRFPRAIAAVGLLAAVCAGVGVRHFGRDRFETDFTRMRRRDSWEVGDAFWAKRLDAVMGQHLNPVAILCDRPEQATEIGRALREASAREPLSRIIDEVRTVRDVLPAEQEVKLAAVREIREVITPKIRSLIPPERRGEVDRMLGTDESTVGLADLPPTFTVGLRERDGRVDRTVLAYVKPTAGMWKSDVVMGFTRELREAAAREAGPGGVAPRVAGQAPISADIIASMWSDGPRATAVALAGVVALLVAFFRARRETLLILGSLLVGVLWLAWASLLLDVRINFCNFVSFPITFGIGVDYAVNVVWRYRLDGRRDVIAAIRSTGGAVGLCSATTIIGYSSLLAAKNQALFSFGVLSVLGEITCLATGVVLLPAVLLVLDGRRGG